MTEAKDSYGDLGLGIVVLAAGYIIIGYSNQTSRNPLNAALQTYICENPQLGDEFFIKPGELSGTGNFFNGPPKMALPTNAHPIAIVVKREENLIRFSIPEERDNKYETRTRGSTALLACNRPKDSRPASLPAPGVS